MRASRCLGPAAAFAALALACALPASAAHPEPRPAPPITLSAKRWTTIQLPATPLGIAAHGKDLWVCGWDEMIAESRDGGRTWRIRHFDREGDLLFALAFAPPHHVYAFGAVDEGLASDNGGKAWGNLGHPAFAVTQAFFAGPNHDLLVGPRGFAFGYPDGWVPKSARGRAHIYSAAMLSANRAILLMVIAASGRGHARAAPYLTWIWHTSDGGHRWPSLRFTRISPLYATAAAGRYWIVATGPKGRPVLLTSTDGANWGAIRGVQRTGFDCDSQGCRDPNGWRPFADISSFTQPWVYPAPPDRGPIVSWAATAGTICDVGSTLRCALTGPREPGPPGRKRALRRGRGGAIIAPECIRCPAPEYPLIAQSAHVQGWAVLDYLVGSHGRVRNVVLIAAPSAALARAAIRSVAGWRYHPALLNGRPITIQVSLTVRFVAQR